MEIKSPMGGNMWKIEVKEGDRVEVGQVVAILESMKMEIPVETEKAGTVSSITASEGDFIQEDDTVMEIEE
ncbi:acetyl-CoA carboxylase biotin carboxyl carrier protein subunit [Salicibibacter cibarius]|uniref:Acetyl-CoA carboxylase biotin carboxyl carrier protein subunit n=1 Tax=Salicibibacter cibarius TaxID=2743000 RepID=A0A7T6Z0Q6_9BACI|nr:acetyl-CoA carboxylase biotin carboxyl carrier protein subunit [Salicibibacter cibarius]QQK74571.1 acetyl-CoA carboxylase biotin carboxyl carrier protein subunit [Salicibibacter cibarius]